MGSRPAKTFSPPGAYALSNPVQAISTVQPEAIAPPQQFLDPGSYSGAGSVAQPAAPVKVKQGGGRGKFFSDDFDPSLYGGGGNPKKPTFPPPVKKPHLPPGGTLTAYKIDSGY